MAHERVLEGIDAYCLLTIELKHKTFLHILIDAVEIVDGPGVFCSGVEEVDTKGEVGLLVVEHPHQRGQDIDLLGYLVLDLRQSVVIAWLIYNDR